MSEMNKPDEYKKYYSSLVWELKKKVSDEYRKEESTVGFYRADRYVMDLLLDGANTIEALLQKVDILESCLQQTEAILHAVSSQASKNP